MEPEGRFAVSPGFLLAATAVVSLAGAAAWPSTEWAAQNDAAEIAERETKRLGLPVEEARKPKKKIECASTVGSRPTHLHLASIAQVPK